MNLKLSLMTTTVLVGLACATSVPAEKGEASSAAIRAAEEVGAKHSPDSALYLQLAKEEFGQARALTDQKNKDRAERLLLRAQVDAELSLALARSESEKSEALGAIEKVKTLKESAVQ